MDKSLGHLLELGVASILFILGLSTFLTMQSNLMNFQQEGIAASQLQGDVMVSKEEETATTISKEALYFVLTEDSHLGKGNWLGEGGYASDTNGINITIDGIAYPVVTDYSGKRSLKLALQTLPSSEFEVNYVVDDEGRLREIRYIGR